MDKDSAKQTQTSGSPALSRGHERQRSSIGEVDMTWGRRASRTLIISRKLSESEQVYNLSRVEGETPEGEGPLEEKSTRLSSTDEESCDTPVAKVTARKRKASTDGDGADTEQKRSPDLNDTKQIQQDLSAGALRAEFEAKYQQQDLLGEGGCGCVYAGYRREDNRPVAIKRVPEENILCKHVDDAGRQLSVEVAVMLRLQEETRGSVGASAPVALLDWYDLGQELILVLERPVPAVDLFHYVEGNGGSLPEEEAKIILKQLVDAAVDLQEKHIFHRDIKVENILIETGSDVPRVRLIDFGLSRFVKKGALYRQYYGTTAHVPPEWYSRGQYSAGPTTVWQMGVVLFETLQTDEYFETRKFMQKLLTISETLSENCQDFLRACSIEDPKQRPTLTQIRLHPWLN
ncbi:serine/threonine-protein kinase pim-1-like [Cyclopterus lumpus]|uniref:serine/threonine-protein kinase pim-1-like n=1 Tax=Cyclopterus lumpus TaxID=8103 RepID=UPI001485C869|nr:serine/threonine-protein kinase pim-1-like [Cyclopterus lumpus]